MIKCCCLKKKERNFFLFLVLLLHHEFWAKLCLLNLWLFVRHAKSGDSSRFILLGKGRCENFLGGDF